MLEAAGAFAAILESMPRELAGRFTRDLRIPTIGIGAGPEVLVFHDLVGLTVGPKPKFAKSYANLSVDISRAVAAYYEDVRNGSFPSGAESYHATGQLSGEAPAHSNR